MSYAHNQWWNGHGITTAIYPPFHGHNQWWNGHGITPAIWHTTTPTANAKPQPTPAADITQQLAQVTAQRDRYRHALQQIAARPSYPIAITIATRALQDDEDQCSGS